MSVQPLKGIHHITAIAADPQRNLDFYTEVMGLRLVKLTVNFDDPGTYHFYFGNEIGTPGSILTFFPWPGAEKGATGAGQVVAIAFAVSIGSLTFWSARLRAHGVDPAPEVQRFGEQVLRFQDPDGLWLELVETEQRDPGVARQRGPVPASYALSGFHSAAISELIHDHTASLVSHMPRSVRSFRTARYSVIRRFTSSRPSWSASNTSRACAGSSRSSDRFAQGTASSQSR